MGDGYGVTCEKCGYKESLYFGIGFGYSKYRK